MNQPRCVLFAALALAALLVGSATAQAATDLSLNLSYTDPADEAAGGTFTLVAKTDDALGVSAISAYLAGIPGLGGDIAFTPGLNHMGILPQTPPREAVMEFGSGTVNAVYGQDMTLPVTGGVGTAAGVSGGAGFLASDPLGCADWDGSTAILTGTFGAARPDFTTEGANETDSNVFTSLTAPTAADADTTVTVRGDGVATDGLPVGDIDRNWQVGPGDFNLLALNFGTGTTWGQGDLNSDGAVGPADFNLLALNFGTVVDPCAASLTAAGVPEPSTLVLVALGLLGLSLIRRK